MLEEVLEDLIECIKYITKESDAEKSLSVYLDNFYLMRRHYNFKDKMISEYNISLKHVLSLIEIFEIYIMDKLIEGKCLHEYR